MCFISKMIANLVLLILILLPTSKCAVTQQAGRAILQGTPAKLGQFPYVVYVENTPLQKEDEELGGSLCTGAILTEHWVVTGSHCYTRYTLKNVKLTDVATEITAGTIDVEHNTTHTQYRVSNTHVMMEKNPDKKNIFYNAIYNNDVILIKVVKAFIFNAYVGAVTIAKRPLPEGKKTTCIAVGFGLVKPPSENAMIEYNYKLYYTSVTLDGDKLSCKKRATKRGAQGKDDFGEENICTDPVDYRSVSCHGDSGGPLVCDGLDVGTLVGRENAHSEEGDCGDKGNYNIYTFLGFYEKWLRKYIPELPPPKLVKVKAATGSSGKERGTSGGGDTRIHMAAIGLVLFIDCVLLHFHSNIHSSSAQFSFL